MTRTFKMRKDAHLSSNNLVVKYQRLSFIRATLFVAFVCASFNLPLHFYLRSATKVLQEPELIPQNLGKGDVVPETKVEPWDPRTGRCRDAPPSTIPDEGPPVMDWRVVVSSNSGFEHVFLNWYKWFTKLGLDKEMTVILIADDSAMYEKYKLSTKLIVKKGWEANTKFTDASLTGDYRYGGKAYKHIVSRRPAFILDQLELGNVLYIDIDVVLKADPRPFFVGTYDLWGQKHGQIDKSDPKHRCKPTFCTGFLALRSNNVTKALVEEWRRRLEESSDGRLNQGVFNSVLYDFYKADAVKAMSLTMDLFPTGRQYRRLTQPQRDEVVLMHNNFCRGGDCKQTRLEEYGLWDPATSEEVM